MGKFRHVTLRTGWGIPSAAFCPSDAQIDELLVLTGDRDPDVRRVAVKNLCPCHVQHHPAHVWKRLFELATQVEAVVERLLHDPDGTVRGYAEYLRAKQGRTGRVYVG